MLEANEAKVKVTEADLEMTADHNNEDVKENGKEEEEKGNGGNTNFLSLWNRLLLFLSLCSNTRDHQLATFINFVKIRQTFRKTCWIRS